MAAMGSRIKKTSPRLSPRKTIRLGPRAQGLREKESLELGRTNFTYDDFKNGTPETKVKILTVRPDIALGKAAGREFEDVQYRIYFVILSSLIIAILTTISYSTIKDENKLREYIVAAFTISWFIFISFIFLLFDATRLLHIIFLTVVLGLISNVNTVLDNEEPSINKQTENIITATIVFVAAAILVLLYYYLTSRKEDELMELKTKEKLRQRNEDISKLVKEAKREAKEEVKNEFKEKYKGVEELNVRVIDKFLSSQSKKKPTEKKPGTTDATTSDS